MRDTTVPTTDELVINRIEEMLVSLVAGQEPESSGIVAWCHRLRAALDVT